MPIKHPDLKTSTSPVTKLTTVWSDSHYKEGIAGGIDFTDGNEEDCNRIDDPGVEAIKVFEV